MQKMLFKLMKPIILRHWALDFLTAIPRVLCGYALTSSFGADKFGMPWSPSDRNLALFQVIDWFPQDVAAYGGLFTMFPVFFAWMAAFSEAVGGLFLVLGLQARIAAFLIACTMLVAVIFQKGDQGLWAILPALGFLWMSMYTLALGSGRFGLDFLISKHFSKTP